MKKTRAHLTIRGTVQGVYFRATTVEVAEKHSVTGWVKNTPDGAVEAVLEGDEDRVKRVIEWCRTGPPMAMVRDVEVEWGEFKGEFDGFRAVTH